jgi:hypothetical protein
MMLLIIMETIFVQWGNMRLPVKERPFSISDAGDSKKNLENVHIAVEQIWNKLLEKHSKNETKITEIYNIIHQLYNNQNFYTNVYNNISGQLHDSVTVVDTDDINLSISGQQISGITSGLTETITFY